MLIRTDAAGATHAFLDWLTERRLSYSIGFTLGDVTEVLAQIPGAGVAAAYTADHQVREGAWVAELTDLLDLTSWPPGMRVIARKERPHPAAHLRLTDVDGHRITAFLTNTRGGQPPELEPRHRQPARAEDRLRNAKDTGRTNLPLHRFDSNRIWCAVVGLASELLAWTQLLAFTSTTPAGGNPNAPAARVHSPGHPGMDRPTDAAPPQPVSTMGSPGRCRVPAPPGPR